ncbi:hypothetical protein [Pseudomonas sp. YL-218 TE3947]|uniref:hypothetical protein n=1 Tax=Pseudomonas TaxID=286 RepID=UPI003D1CDCC2
MVIKSSTRVSREVKDLLHENIVKFIRVVGASGDGLSSALDSIQTLDCVSNRCLTISDIFFSGRIGFIGWFANALGVFEGVNTRPGFIPPFLLEFARLRDIGVVLIDDFHEVFRAPGITVGRLMFDINSLLAALPELRIIICEAEDIDSPNYVHLLNCPVANVKLRMSR